ncbi:MAG: hypothetical protein NXI18_18625 [Alphaproteobacteria bacterium]|nr:hypothetical protein [Alphaproteobacteria bacterium]
MGEVIAFRRPRSDAQLWTVADLVALDRLAARTDGAAGWEIEPTGGRAFVTGAEDETLLIVSRERTGLSVTSGWARIPHWHGSSLERYG